MSLIITGPRQEDLDGKMLENCSNGPRQGNGQSRTCATYMALEKRFEYGAQWTSDMGLRYLDLHV